MSTLWTPDGERPVRREPEPAATGPAPDPSAPDTQEISAEDEARMRALQEELAHTPVELVVANHAFGLFELAALHLSLQPPQLARAQLAIDALGALVEGLAGRLGEYESQLVDGLANLRLAYVQLRNATASSQPLP